MSVQLKTQCLYQKKLLVRILPKMYTLWYLFSENNSASHNVINVKTLNLVCKLVMDNFTSNVNTEHTKFKTQYNFCCK